MKALTKTPPPWHQEAKQLLTENFEKIHLAFTDATKRAVWLGMFLNHIKARGKEDGSIPHGQFGKWLEQNVPDLDRKTISTYQRIANGVCEKGKFQNGNFSHFAEIGQLPPPIEQLVEGKTQQQLLINFGQIDDENPEVNAGRRGQKPGSKGLTKEQRAKAAERAEQEFLNELEETVVERTAWLLEIADAKHLGALEVGVLRKFVEAAEIAGNFAKSIIKSRG